MQITIKPILYFFTISFLFLGAVSKEEYLDPTGTYQLGKKRKAGEEIREYFGQIKVKSLSKEKIVISCDVNKGAPSYNSGFLIDTLAYDGKSALFIYEDDSSCKITFDFTKKGVTVKQEAKDFNFSCGFGHAVIIDDFFKKKSSKEPVFDY